MAPDRSPTPSRWALVASAVLVPTVLAGSTLVWPRPAIESSLLRGAAVALAAAGFADAAVTVSGRDVTIDGVPPDDAAQAVRVVEAVPGVRVAALGGPGPAGSAPFGIARQGDSVVVTGGVGTPTEKAQLLAAATAAASGRTVVDRLAVVPGAVLPAGIDARSVGALASAIGGAAGDLSASIGPGGVTLTGTVADDAAKRSAERAVSAAVPGLTLADLLTVPAAAGPTAGDLDPAAKLALQGQLSALQATAPITFEPDSPALTPQGARTVDQVVAAVRAAPNAHLQIDGFVALGPARGPLTAQQLSDRRAAVVRDALIAGGVPADHTAATGRGEGTSPTNGALGRRAVVRVV